MSVGFIFFLSVIGTIICSIAWRNGKGGINGKYTFLENLAMGYLFILWVAAFLCIIVGIFNWLIEGVWQSVTPISLFSNMPNAEFLDWLLPYSSWIGVQKINYWLLSQNLAWSLFLAPIISIFLAKQFAKK